MDNIYINYGLLYIIIIIAIISIIISLILFRKIQNIKIQLNKISEILDDITQGNSNRRILAHPHDITTSICYKINKIVHYFQNQIIELKKSEKTNKQLMTSLSHDIRTPLTTLIGYLDAAQKGIVFGSEREEYIETARKRAYYMKDYVNSLFEWFKLNSDEESFTIQKTEITELTRIILKDWIPIFENSFIDIDIDIPEDNIEVSLDSDAYCRILNNLLQNIVSHSKAKHIKIKVFRENKNILIIIEDDGIGISEQDLPYIFDRLYKCDRARSEQGSGLGLSIVKKLIDKMSGTITVESVPNKRTSFKISFSLL